MKKLSKTILISVMAISAIAANATVFTDATGDVANPMLGTGNTNIDIASFEITNTASTISFKFTTAAASITSPDWTKYMVIMRNTSNASLSSSNGWSRPISLAGGANAWAAGWVDSGGNGEAYSYNGSWNFNGTAAPVISGNTVTYTRNLSSFGLTMGDTIIFDAMSSGGGGGDGAWDLLSLSTPSSTNWGQAVESNSQLSYTVVPEPASMTALVLGAAAMMRRRKA